MLSPQRNDKIRILVAEDDAGTRLLYDEGLFDQIFDKKMVVSGREAMLAYEEWHPDIMILDIYMPEMTGYQVLKEIRTIIGDKQTTIVMATALNGKDDVLSCIKLGIEGYIIKPCSLLQILTKILGYYSKKDHLGVQQADAVCRDAVKQYQAKLLSCNDKLIETV